MQTQFHEHRSRWHKNFVNLIVKNKKLTKKKIIIFFLILKLLRGRILPDFFLEYSSKLLLSFLNSSSHIENTLQRGNDQTNIGSEPF